MKNSYIASYDVGTSGVKATLVNFNGEVCSISNANYPLITPFTGWAEQDPGAYWDAVCHATRKAIIQINASPEEVKGVAFGSQWKGIIPLDNEDRVLYNAIIWLDGRAGEQANKLNKKLGTEVFYNQEYWPRLMWVKENMPELYQKTNCFLEVNSFLKFKATGIKVVDLTNDFIHANSKTLQNYYDKIIEAADLDPAKFPPLVLPTDHVGSLTEKASKELGLLKGTPVFGGCGDIPAIAIGAGCSSIGSSHIYLGSSGWFGNVIHERQEGIGELYQSFDKGKDLMVYALQSACMTLNWAIDQFYRAEKETLKEDIYKFVDTDISKVEPGSLNMIATPWIHGELYPLSKNAKAVFFNVTNQHDRRYFISAIMEGIGYMLRWKIETYQAETSKKIDSIRAVGGGACSEPWMQMMANILQIPVHVPHNPRHSGAIGTAYCAMVGLGVCKSFEEADNKIQPEKIYLPQTEFATRYGLLFNTFKKMYPALKDMYDTLNCLPNSEYQEVISGS